MNHTLTSLALVGFVAFVTGCATGAPCQDNPSTVEEETETTDDGELSASSRSYVTLRHDDRKCAAPMCGGYWVRDLNRKMVNEQYVSALDFAKSGLTPDRIQRALEANPQDLVLRAKLGPKDVRTDTRTLLVYEAYRGMPGVTPLEGETFFLAGDREPQITCVTAPCSNETAKKLNSTQTTHFDRYAVTRALKAFVDETWLTDRVHKHGALVSASIIPGQKLAGGYEQVLDASQVYVRLDASSGPCAEIKMEACPSGQTWVYTRDADLCVVPDKCVAEGSCPSLQWPQCAEGYSVTGWRVDSKSCTQFACDPSFVDQY